MCFICLTKLAIPHGSNWCQINSLPSQLVPPKGSSQTKMKESGQSSQLVPSVELSCKYEMKAWMPGSDKSWPLSELSKHELTPAVSEPEMSELTQPPTPPDPWLTTTRVFLQPRSRKAYKKRFKSRQAKIMAGLSPEDFQRMQASQLSDVETLDTLRMTYWSNGEFHPVGFDKFHIWDIACRRLCWSWRVETTLLRSNQESKRMLLVRRRPKSR